MARQVGASARHKRDSVRFLKEFYRRVQLRFNPGPCAVCGKVGKLTWRRVGDGGPSISKLPVAGNMTCAKLKMAMRRATRVCRGCTRGRMVHSFTFHRYPKKTRSVYPGGIVKVDNMEYKVIGWNHKSNGITLEKVE